MASSRRHPRHQGVRYGPPRDRQRFNDNGVLIGRMVGLGVLLLTMGVLAAAAVAFIGERPRSAPSPARSSSVALSPTPTRASAASPAPTTLPSIVPSPASAVPSTAVAPPATVPPPQVQIGKGFVTFGTQTDGRLHIVDPRVTFSVNERIVWSAYLRRRADSAELRVHIFKLDGTPPTGERLIADEAVTPLVRGAQIFERSIMPVDILDGPGIYVVRYVRGTDILSQGSLEITS